MSHISFKDLIDETFEDQGVHLKHLKSLFEILVTHLKLSNVQVYIENQDSLEERASSKRSNNYQTPIQSSLKVIQPCEKLKKSLCNSENNPIVDMLDLVNVTKRVEALEVSFRKMTLLMETALKNQSSTEEKLKDLNQLVEGFRRFSGISSKDEYLDLRISETQEDFFEELSSETHASVQVDDVKTPVKFNGQEIEDIVKRHVVSSTDHVKEMFSTLKQEICELQKKTDQMQEQIDDLMFASEQNDLKIDETADGIKNFTSKIFCLKTDVKTLIKESEEFKEKFKIIDVKYETINKVKTDKFYVDELWRQKAFNSELEFYIRREEFEPVSDIIRLKLGLLEDHFTTLKVNLKKSLACFKLELDEKLDKNELQKFRNVMSNSFEDFLNGLKSLLYEMMRSSVGVGGTKSLSHDLKCISCKSSIAMKKSELDIPQLDSISYRFKKNLDKSCPKTINSNADFRRFFGVEEKEVKDKIIQKDPRLNFPNSQHCFIISNDNSIFKADPLKCLNSSKYSQS